MHNTKRSLPFSYQNIGIYEREPIAIDAGNFQYSLCEVLKNVFNRANSYQLKKHGSIVASLVVAEDAFFLDRINEGNDYCLYQQAAKTKTTKELYRKPKEIYSDAISRLNMTIITFHKNKISHVALTHPEDGRLLEYIGKSARRQELIVELLNGDKTGLENLTPQ